MFCVTEYMLRMPHGVHSFDRCSVVGHSGGRGILGRAGSGLAAADHRSSHQCGSTTSLAAAEFASSAESVKRQRRDDGDDPSAGSGGSGAAGGLCAAPIGSA